jgi:hypothetical protein
MLSHARRLGFSEIGGIRREMRPLGFLIRAPRLREHEAPQWEFDPPPSPFRYKSKILHRNKLRLTRSDALPEETWERR